MTYGVGIGIQKPLQAVFPHWYIPQKRIIPAAHHSLVPLFWSADAFGRKKLFHLLQRITFRYGYLHSGHPAGYQVIDDFGHRLAATSWYSLALSWASYPRRRTHEKSLFLISS